MPTYLSKFMVFLKGIRAFPLALKAVKLHQMGLLALDKRDFRSAEIYLKESFEIESKINHLSGIAKSYGALGSLGFTRAMEMLMTEMQISSQQFGIWGFVKITRQAVGGKPSDHANMGVVYTIRALYIFQQLNDNYHVQKMTDNLVVACEEGLVTQKLIEQTWQNEFGRQPPLFLISALLNSKKENGLLP